MAKFQRINSPDKGLRGWNNRQVGDQLAQWQVQGRRRQQQNRAARAQALAVSRGAQQPQRESEVTA